MPLTLTKPKLPFAARLRRRRREAEAPEAPLWTLPLPTGTTAGLAQVLRIEPDGRPRVRLLNEPAEVVIRWALPYHYQAREGDLVWVVAQGERAYGLGVARGTGRSFLWFDGDVTISARGTLRLAADQGLRVLARTLSLRAEALEVTADTIHERTTDVVRRVKGLTQLIAGRVRRVTAGAETVVADRVTIQSAEPVRIAGENVVSIQ